MCGEEQIERRAEHEALDLPARNADALKDHAVEEAPRGRVGGTVRLGAVGHQGHRAVQDLLPLGEGRVGGFQEPLDFVRLSRDALLLRPEQINVDGALVVGVHHLPALVLQLHQAPCLEGSLVAVRGVAGDDVCLQLVTGAERHIGRKLDALVHRLDRGLQAVGRDVGLTARLRLAPVLLAETEEVLVLALGPLDREVASAHGADESAFQVVVVLPLAGAARRSRGQELLHAIPRRALDQRVVRAAVLDAVPLDHADVELVDEQVVHPGDGERHGRPSPARP
ncbi:MAG TPA: hypothetical protein VN193_11060 [Candidatus Angelobacter sp.]|nr:hypothetical protein [Candidatus Angelobacter sp.]